jgi:hypothetical protein
MTDQPQTPEANATPEIEEEEILLRYKRAHLAGWMTQQIVGGNATSEQAKQNFDYNDQKANAILHKYANIRETILQQTGQTQSPEAAQLQAENHALREQLAQTQQ